MGDILRLRREDKFSEPDFLLEVNTWENHGDYPAHVHEFSKIAIVQKGQGIADIEGELFPFHKGDVFVMHGNRSNAYKDTLNLTMTNVLFSPGIIDLNRFEPGLLPGYQALFVVSPALRSEEGYNRHLTLNVDQLIKVKALTDIMEKELQEKVPGYRLMAMGHFLILVTLLSRYYLKSDLEHGYHAIQLGKALSYIEEHYTDTIDIEYLSKLSGMSVRSFFRLFPKVTGDTPNAYQNRLRILRAVEMLELSDKSVTEIAFDCGFQDSNYFSRQFKSIMGIPPSQFRKRYNRLD